MPEPPLHNRNCIFKSRNGHRSDAEHFVLRTLALPPCFLISVCDERHSESLSSCRSVFRLIFPSRTSGEAWASFDIPFKYLNLASPGGRLRGAANSARSESVLSRLFICACVGVQSFSSFLLFLAFFTRSLPRPSHDPLTGVSLFTNLPFFFLFLLRQPYNTERNLDRRFTGGSQCQ